MERLTERYRNNDNTGVSKGSLIDRPGKGYPSSNALQIITKLADYEDAEEQGLLFRCPCKVGDTVWFVGETFVNDYEVRRFIIDETGIVCIQIAKEIDGRDYWNSCCCEDFGKTVFLSESEAEQALAEKVS